MRLSFVGFLSVFLSSLAFAAEPTGETAEAPGLPFKEGPFVAEPGHNIQLNVPEGYAFLGMPDADKFMRQNGNFHNENLLGVILPTQEDMGNWAAIVRFDDEGHIRDDEKVDGDEILESFKDGEEAMNQERTKAGFSALHVVGWKEAPRYDAAAHHLVWGLEVKSDGEDSHTMNYSTRILGRTGYVSLNLVTAVSDFETDRIHAATLLKNTQFKPGFTYADFNESTDKVAEYGLTGLVLGGAGLGLAKAAKVGIFAKFGKVLLALILGLKKALIPLLLALGFGLKKLLGLFGRKSESA